jgi:hypothetical protein
MLVLFCLLFLSSFSPQSQHLPTSLTASVAPSGSSALVAKFPDKGSLAMAAFAACLFSVLLTRILIELGERKDCFAAAATFHFAYQRFVIQTATVDS